MQIREKLSQVWLLLLAWHSRNVSFFSLKKCKYPASSTCKYTVHKTRKKTRRSLKKPKPKQFIVIGTNADGLNGKRDSLYNTIEEVKPVAFLIQETKFSRKGTFKLENFEIFEQVRTHKGVGALLTGVQVDLSLSEWWCWRGYRNFGWLSKFIW